MRTTPSCRRQSPARPRRSRFRPWPALPVAAFTNSEHRGDGGVEHRGMSASILATSCGAGVFEPWGPGCPDASAARLFIDCQPPRAAGIRKQPRMSLCSRACWLPEARTYIPAGMCRPRTGCVVGVDDVLGGSWTSSRRSRHGRRRWLRSRRTLASQLPRPPLSTGTIGACRRKAGRRNS